MTVNNRPQCCKYIGCSCVCWRTGDAVNISTILVLHDEEAGCNPLSRCLEGGLCTAHVKDPHMLQPSGFSKSMHAKQTPADARSHFLAAKQSSLSSKRGESSAACQHMLPKWVQTLQSLHCNARKKSVLLLSFKGAICSEAWASWFKATTLWASPRVRMRQGRGAESKSLHSQSDGLCCLQ